MQRWEYKTLYRTRRWTDDGSDNFSYQGGKWNITVDGQQYQGNDMHPLLRSLGDEGWELVAISPRSGFLGRVGDRDYAGFTSEEHWVFKRPKP